MLTVQIGSYGLGLALQGEGEDLAFSHGGDSRGYHSFLFAYARRGQGVAVMTNGENGSSLYQEILRSVALAYDWPSLKPSVFDPAHLPAEALSLYAGRYVFNNALPTTVTVEDDHLKMVGDDGRTFLWYPYSDRHFIDMLSGWELELIRSEQHEVTGAVIAVGNVKLRGERVDASPTQP